ncbi:TPA: hypothetical protein ACMDOB_002943 [Vibrio metschnikovii]|nr:hypothetical protein [Vibrio metschnikovii]EKO3658930.1 hypothetical protein [Vibrio metschnikovii]
MTDTLRCQVETLKKVVDKVGNMLVEVKQNQPVPLNEINMQSNAYWVLP